MQKKSFFIFSILCATRVGLSSSSTCPSNPEQGVDTGAPKILCSSEERRPVKEIVTITMDGPVKQKRQFRLRSTNKGCRVDATASKIYHTLRDQGSDQSKTWDLALQKVLAGGGSSHQGEIVTGDVNGRDVVTITHDGPVLHRSHVSNLTGS